MAHFMIDYSKNLEERMDMSEFCDIIRRAAIETGIFPVAGIRVRATAVDHVSMADGNPDHAFLDLSVRLRAGRPQEAKEAATAHIFAAAEAQCKHLLNSSSFMLSMEMRDIDPALSPKTSSIRKYLPEDMH